MHYHVKTVSLMGLNLSRPLATRELAEWVQAEIDAACWSQGLAENTAVELVECASPPHASGCGLACRFCGELATIDHRCDGQATDRGRAMVGTKPGT